MGRFIDLTGKVFGRLTVLKFIRASRNGESIWECLCSCGNSKIIYYGNLTSGNTKSCGCYSKEVNNKRLSKDIENVPMGNLIPIRRIDKNSNGEYIWECRCLCGNIKNVRIGHLLSNKISSCGCLKDSFISRELKKYYAEFYEAKKEYKILVNDITGYFLPFDIYIPYKKIFIEVNGVQHYENNKYFYKNTSDFEYRKKLDRIKRKYARQNGIYIEIDLRKIKTVEKAIEIINNYL